MNYESHVIAAMEGRVREIPNNVGYEIDQNGRNYEEITLVTTVHSDTLVCSTIGGTKDWGTGRTGIAAGCRDGGSR